MHPILFRLALAALPLMLLAAPGAAQSMRGPRPPVRVPEIDASSGLLAAAAVLAALAFAWEVRRRRATR